ncbi:MAG TPA: glycosyltransferase family 1 protein [Bryobacteraceae bacterium]|nr:glycosyltransferase family 1 protein [Bryobacteraceae bacterium]
MLVRSAGVKSYVWHWLRHLRKHAAADVEILAFPLLGKDLPALDHESSALSRPQTMARLALIKLMNETGLPPVDWLIGGSQIFHGTNLMRRPPRRAKLTATIHDLTCWLMPDVHSPGNVAADRRFGERILRRADGLIAVSENTRQDAIRVLGIAPERIRTIYSGIAETYFQATAVSRPRPYVLYTGAIEPRKNLDTLLDAWKLLKPSLRAEFELLIAGPRGWAPQETFARIQTEATYLGYVPEANLPILTAGAAAFVYPSLYEGFGFPVVQAMAAGAPVVTSNNSCLPEIAGDAALFVDARSAAEIASSLTRLLESPPLREEMAARGRKRAQQFRWDTCAKESLQFFRGVLGSL